MRIPLTDKYTVPSLRSVAQRSQHAGQARRLMALAALYDGATRTEAAAMAGVTVQIIRDWILKLNARGPAAGHASQHRPAAPAGSGPPSDQIPIPGTPDARSPRDTHVNAPRRLAARRASPFLPATSFSIALSSIALASSFFSRAFFASSVRSRRASETSRPPNFVFHW